MGIADTIGEALGQALTEPGCAPGAQLLREAEKRVAFAGGSFGMAGASAFDVAAFVVSLRDVLFADAESDAERAALARIFDWFCALAVEGYAKSREDALRLRHRDTLERGTPVVMLAPELPVAFLIGEPDRTVLEAAFGRLLLAVVRAGARAVVLDAGGLGGVTDPPALDALHSFAAHRKVAGQVTLVVSGLPPDAHEEWRRTAGDRTTVVFTERFEDAVTEALSVGGMQIQRKRGS